MDTHFVKMAEQQYREKTGDRRPWDLLPPSVQSKIIMDAEKLKRDASEGPLTIQEVLDRTSVTTSLGSVVGTSFWRSL